MSANTPLTEERFLEIVKNLATKDDLKDFATQDNIKSLTSNLKQMEARQTHELSKMEARQIHELSEAVEKIIDAVDNTIDDLDTRTVKRKEFDELHRKEHTN